MVRLINWSSLLRKQGVYLLALVLLLVVYLLASYPPVIVQSLASALSDDYFEWNKRKPSDELIFIDIENTSVQLLGRWPWPRNELAKGLKKLEKAKVVGLDMVFSESTELDQELALELEKLPVIGGVFLNGPNAGRLIKDPEDKTYSKILYSSLTEADDLELLGSNQVEVPTEILQESLFPFAALNINPDADQKLRHYPLAFSLHDAVLPNLGVQMWRLVRNEIFYLNGIQAQLNGKELPVDQKMRARINYYPEGSWQRIPFAELMQDDFDPQRVAERWVMVGVSEAGVSDIRPTPIGYLPGPLVHLTLVANLLDNSLLTDIKGEALLASLAFVFFLLIVIWQLTNPWLRLLLSFVLGLSIAVAGVVGYVYFNLWLEIFYPLLFLLLTVIAGEVWFFVVNRAETAYIRSAFSSYVAPSLVDKLVQQGAELQLGGKRQQLTVLFSDLRDFTPTTESLETEELVSHLNRYFGLMIDEVHRYKGTLDKLMGDAVMALFNAPLADEDHAYHACLAAAGMMQALEVFNQQYTQEDDPRLLKMGLGINTGEAIVGNIGAANRFNYTAIGDVVNVSARLESATKEVNLSWQAAKEVGEVKPCERVDVLMGEQTYAAVKNRLPCYPVANLALKGKSATQKAWVLDWRKMIEQGLLL